MSKLIWPGFILLVIVQWWVPSQMIWHKQRTLRYGIPYKFRSAPVDPSDPFIGNYIHLNLTDNTFSIPAKNRLTSGTTVYVTFNTGPAGYARIANVSKVKPSVTGYLEATISYRTDESDKDSSTLFISYPFEKFYLDEYKAPEAERKYNKSRNDTTRKTYALVCLLNGDAAIKDVFINDTSLLQTLHRKTAVK